MLDALATRKTDENGQDTAGFEYTLQPILFVVPQHERDRDRNAQARGRGPARPLQQLRRRPAVRPRAARRRGARPGQEDFGRPAAALAQDPRRHGSAASPTRRSRRRASRCSRCARARKRRSRPPAKRQMREELFAEKFQAESKRYLRRCGAGDDRDQVVRRCSSRSMPQAIGADARRAGRHRPGHHDCGLAAPRRTRVCRPSIFIADPRFMRGRASALGLAAAARRGRARTAAATAFATRCRWSTSRLPSPPRPASPDASSAPAAIASIRRAVADVFAGRAAAVVTNPIAKNVLYRSGFAEPGHTEFLARLAHETDRRRMPGR